MYTSLNVSPGRMIWPPEGESPATPVLHDSPATWTLRSNAPLRNVRQNLERNVAAQRALCGGWKSAPPTRGWAYHASRVRGRIGWKCTSETTYIDGGVGEALNTRWRSGNGMG